MVDENKTLTWNLAVQLLDANFHFRAQVGVEGRSYRASPNGAALQISQNGQNLEVQLPVEVASLSGSRLSGTGHNYRYAVSTVRQLLNCIRVLTNDVKTDMVQEMAEPGNMKVNMGIKLPLNTILYGPPGTGKTYSVVLKAMSIVDGNDYGLAVSSEKYNDLKQRYDTLVRRGQISFVTFHQSYGYEDFVEGIRPHTEGQQISYEVRDGILKTIALVAKENWQKASEQGRETQDDESLFERVWQDLVENLEESADGKVRMKLYRGADAEVEQGQTGKSVVVSLPGYKTTYNIPKKQIKMLWNRRKEISSPSDTKLYNRSFFWAVLEHLKELAGDMQPEVFEPEELKSFVLVIDEINRGNISKIFGELITLVEDDKRLGETFEMTVTLPYSQGDEEPFGLPPNLYLVGTMNTSDRSIALLDTALRRRFEFEELQPNPEVLQGIQLDVNVDLSALLSAINERVEYLYDRDHTIGHAYFVGVKSLPDLERVFRRKVIPLLQEYFYEDWSKVVLVLNDSAGHFVERDVRVPSGLQGTDIGIEPKPRFKVSDTPFSLEAFQNIYHG
jgi:5-methylcytosine-specific restriction protein B